MTSDGATLKHFIETSRIRPVSIYKSMDISKQAFYKLYESKSFEPDTIEKIEKAIGKKWEDVKKVNIDVNPTIAPKGQHKKAEETNENMNTLIQSNKILAEANKKLSDAHFILAEDQRELMRRVVTADDPQQTSLELIAIRQAVVEFVIEVASGKRYKDRHEAGQAYSKRVAELIEATKGKDIQKNWDKLHTVK
jgi:predicted transcriptional regulator